MTESVQSVRSQQSGEARKNKLRLLVCAVLTAISVYALVHELWHYEPHVTDGLGPVLFSFVAIAFAIIYTVRFVKRKAWGALSVTLVCLALSGAVLYVSWHIPLCVECQHLTKADLGFLCRWIWAPD